MGLSRWTGLCAFPITPADADGQVDTAALGSLVDRIASAGVGSIGVLGSTGAYAYLDRAQRARALRCAVEAADGRAAIVAGIGAMRTAWAQDLARDAEAAGAHGLLMAPMSYTPLVAGEVVRHFEAVAGETALPLCIYNNPGTTRFAFPRELIADMARIPGIAAVKMPPPTATDLAFEIADLRSRCPQGFAIGYSGDWVAAPALLAGADAWYSVIGGLFPRAALRLTRAAAAKDVAQTAALSAAFEPLWQLFRTHGSFRLVYDIADLLDLGLGDPPAPVRRLDGVRDALADAVERVRAL